MGVKENIGKGTIELVLMSMLLEEGMDINLFKVYQNCQMVY